MKKLAYSTVFLVGVWILMAFPAPARADGIIIPEPPICFPGPCPPIPAPLSQLSIRYHHVSVTIQDQIVITHVDQVFFNPNEWDIEGIYLFPLPKDAAVTSFTLWMDNEPVEGRILEAQEARQIYEDIVRDLQDPALVEYVDRGAVQASIFPIPSKGERRIELEYSQVLTSENGLVRYVYPLSTEKFSREPLDSVSIQVSIQSKASIRAVYSPSHRIAVSRESDYLVNVGYEELDVLPDTDFALYYSLGEEQAFHLMSFRDPGDLVDPDGFFLLLLAARPATHIEILPKDVILVLDRSGSMDGDKFKQAQEALRYILNNLNPGDRFNIITFSTGTERYASGLVPASEAGQASVWVDRLYAEGSTDINRALLEAALLADSVRPTYVIFLTDGLPTTGEVDSHKILDNLFESAPKNMRLFSFGVGYDVDTFLLDSLSESHRGVSTYVVPGERLDEVLSDFYGKVSAPVLTDLELDFGGISVYDLYPAPLPDLFAGSQIILVGRYRQPGEATITLTGQVNDEVLNFTNPGQTFSESGRKESSVLEFIPRLWATRKIGYLLNQARLHGPDPEIVDQIVRLSIRYGIITPYTSYLITEDYPLGAGDQNRIAAEQYKSFQSELQNDTFGQEAVQRAMDQGALAGADTAAPAGVENYDLVRIAGSRTFVFKDGVWLDTAFDPASTKTVKVSFLSEDYFSLARSRPELATAFALGEKVIAMSAGSAFEVVGKDEAVPDIEIAPMATLGVGDTLPILDTPAPHPNPTQLPVSTPRTSFCPAGIFPVALIPVVFVFTRKGRRFNRRTRYDGDGKG